MRRINRLSAEVCFSGRMRSRRCPELPENDEKQQKGDTFFKRPPLDWHPVRGAASLSCPPGGKPASHQSLRKRRRQSMGRRRKRRTLTAMIQYRTLLICQAEMFMRSSTPSAESGSVGRVGIRLQRGCPSLRGSENWKKFFANGLHRRTIRNEGHHSGEQASGKSFPLRRKR